MKGTKFKLICQSNPAYPSKEIFNTIECCILYLIFFFRGFVYIITFMLFRISEARRLRLQELEKQLADYRRKILDLQKVEKLKEQNQQTIKTLRSDVEVCKPFCQGVIC